MNRQKNIAVFAVIAAITMTTVGLSSVSTTALMVAPQQSEGVGMLGHLEYIVRDSNDQVIRYVQGDNTVVGHGKDCVAENTFGLSDNANCVADFNTNPFQYIAIGNGTLGTVLPAYNAQIQLTNNTADGCTVSGSYGEINRFGPSEGVAVSTTALAVNASDGLTGTGTVVELNTDTAFDFTAANATTIRQSGIFSAGYDEAQCADAPKGGTSSNNMFAMQELNSANGIVVTAGDSLSVKWTITVG